MIAGAVAAGGAGVAFGDVVVGNEGGLVAVGPTSGANGFPTWYKDKNGDRLTLCLDANDPNCGFLPGDVPDPTKPISFPDNFPDEAFYQLAGSAIDLPGGGRAVSTFALEAAFSNAVQPGDQIVFGRVRFQYRGLTPGGEYTITHPYGVDKVTAEPDGSVFVTEDIGITSFAAALKSRIGPFLKWDPAVGPAAPQGYLGDPDVEHQIVGSPHDTNFVRIEGPGLGTTGAVESNLFTVQGKYATNGGVDVGRVTYSRAAGATGGTISVFASSEPVANQSIQISDPANGFDPTLLEGANGSYAALVDFKGAPPATVNVTNASDVPADTKEAKVVDAITGTATYDADTDVLTIHAESSDKAAPPTLTAAPFGDLDASGNKEVTGLLAPPANVTVTSSAGGTVDLPVTMTGTSFAPIPVMAFAGTDQEVVQGDTVTLDGTGSSGPITGQSWTQTAGTPVTLTGADTMKPTFTAPTLPDGTPQETLTFELTVEGAGGPTTATVNVTVFAQAAALVANAGPDQTVAQGAAVTLDGSGSSPEARTFSWKQVGAATDPQVTLTGADTAKPTFTFPRQNVALTFQLTVTGGGATATDEVVVKADGTDRLTLARAQYDRAKREWRVEGSSSVFGPGVTITIHNGNTVDATTGKPNGPVIGTADVDNLGAWRFRGTGPAPLTPAVIALESTAGGTLLNQPVSVK